MMKELKTSPYIIAKKLHEYQSVRSYTEKYDLLGIGVHAKINLSINCLIRPSLGDWLNLLQEYITTKARAGEALFMQELPAL